MPLTQSPRAHLTGLQSATWLLSPQSRDIPSLTVLRGLLAVWVVGYHYSNDILRIFPALNSSRPFLQAGGFAVPGFFLLSGFVLAHNYAHIFYHPQRRAIAKFFGMRLARIYPVHLITLLTVVLMVFVGRRLNYHLTDSGYTKLDFALNVLLMHYWVPHFTLNWNYPSWSISAEWFAYLAFPFLAYAAVRQLRTKARAGAAIAFCLAGTVFVYCVATGPLLVITVLPTFCTGVALHALDVQFFVTRREGLRWWPDLMAGFMVVVCWLPSPWSVPLLLVATGGLIGCLVIAREATHGWWTSRPLVFLGEISFSLYMTHTLAQKVLYRLLPVERVEAAALAPRVATLLAYFALVASWCLLTYYLVERPARRWGRSRLSLV